MKNVTVVIPTSPRPSHPSTAIIDATINSIRHWLPESKIAILCDGIRPEFENRRAAYYEFVDRLIKANRPNVDVIVHSKHRHQTALLVELLPSVDTPLLLWNEDDIPLLTDRPIEWEMMAEALLSGAANSVRLMLTESVHDLHLYLYFGPVDGYPHLLKQKQISGWTHLASTEFYRKLLANFDTRAQIMVERYAVRLVDPAPWEQWKLTSYVPDPGHAKRIHHLDGRADPTRDNGNGRDPSFEEFEIYPPPL